MPKAQDVPNELRQFNKLFERLNNKWDNSTVFDDFLTICMCYFSAGEMKEEYQQVIKRYDKHEIEIFYEMLKCWLFTVREKIGDSDTACYDFFGNYYQVLASMSKQQRLGQFFTPESVTDMMAKMLMGVQPQPEKGKWIIAGDPACGSGRAIVAMHVHLKRNAYYVAEDIDQICCKMTCLNMVIHGCVGEVVWHNSLDPDSFYGGWQVNNTLPYMGVPSIIKTERENLISMQRKPAPAVSEVQRKESPAIEPQITLETAERISGQQLAMF